MAAKKFLFGEAGRARLLEGARVLAGAVKPTLGPSGRTVLLQRPQHGAPLVTKDGVTVAEEVELHDRFANMGAQMVIESAAKTSIVAGDGTTTATVLAHAIYREGAKLVAAGFHPIDIKRGIELAVERAVAALAKASRPLRDDKDVARVATVSANGDATVGKLIAQAVGKVGQEGIIHVEQGTALETKLEVSEGAEVDRGFSSMYFITDPERLVAELENPYLLIYENKISAVQPLLPILEKVSKTGRPLLVIGELTGDALSLLVVNKLQGTLKVCGINPPFYSDSRKAALGDLAAQTGGRVVSEDIAGLTLASVTLEDLGQAKKIVVDQEKTTVVGGKGKKVEIDARVAEIRRLYDDTNSTFRHQQLDERLRRLVGGAALIKVGGTTDAETRERKARLEDALFATRAAIEEGIVPGGGVALMRAAAVLDRRDPDLSEGEAAGVEIVRRACEVPLGQIAENAGKETSVVVHRVRAAKGAVGYNARTDEHEDLLAAGVVDPTKVVRLALQNAASIATLLITSEALIIDAPRDAAGNPESGSWREGLDINSHISRR
jgi:chaperonin GroEL